LILLVVIVSYFELFKISAIPNTVRYFSQVLSSALILIFILLGIIYLPAHREKMHFSAPILILIIGAIPSIFMARYFHHQPIIASIWAYRILFFYLLYFFLHFYKVQVKYIINSIVIIGFLAVAMYYIQYFLFPKMIFDITFLAGRGTIRLFIAGMLCTQFAYFYFLHQFYTRKKVIHLILCLLSLSIFILQGTRQTIFALVFLTLIYILFSRKIRSKAVILIIFSLAMIAAFFIFREIFNELTKVSSAQVRNLSGGIRLRAMKFYLTDFMPNKLAYVFGNGSSGMGSAYERKLVFIAIKYKFYLADIGIIGDYVKYGIVFTIGGLAMIIKSIGFKVSSKYSYLKYYIYSQCFTLIAGYGIFGGVDIIILMILYIFDIDRANSKKQVD